MMSRTQISLDSEMHRQARRRADELGVSLSEYVRSLVARDLKTPERKADVSIIFGLGDGGETDIGKDKRRLIGEAFAAGRRK
jgi:hypothetical protein